MPSEPIKFGNVPSTLPVHKSRLGHISTPSPRLLKTPSTTLHPTSLTTIYEIYEEYPTKLPKAIPAGSSSPPQSTPCKRTVSQRTSRLPRPSSPMQRSRSVRGATRLTTPMTPLKRTPTVPEPAKTTHFAAAHLGTPCTTGALMHTLDPCGHRLLTIQPELCAANCRHTRPADHLHPNGHSQNPKDITAPFVCPICVDEKVKTEILDEVKAWTAMGVRLLGIRHAQDSDAVRDVDPSIRVLCEKIAGIRTAQETNGRKCFSYEDERMLHHPSTLPAPKSLDQAMLAYGVRMYMAVVSDALEMKQRESDRGNEVAGPLHSSDRHSRVEHTVELLQREVGRLKRRGGTSRSPSPSSSSGRTWIGKNSF